MADGARGGGTKYSCGREVAGGGMEMGQDWSGIAYRNYGDRKQKGDVEDSQVGNPGVVGWGGVVGIGASN